MPREPLIEKQEPPKPAPTAPAETTSDTKHQGKPNHHEEEAAASAEGIGNEDEIKQGPIAPAAKEVYKLALKNMVKLFSEEKDHSQKTPAFFSSTNQSHDDVIEQLKTLPPKTQILILLILSDDDNAQLLSDKTEVLPEYKDALKINITHDNDQPTLQITDNANAIANTDKPGQLTLYKNAPIIKKIPTEGSTIEYFRLQDLNGDRATDKIKTLTITGEAAIQEFMENLFSLNTNANYEEAEQAKLLADILKPKPQQKEGCRIS